MSLQDQMSPLDALRAIAEFKVPCRKCGKAHQSWENPATKARQWSDRMDGHPYHRMGDAEFAEAYIGNVSPWLDVFQ